MKKINLKCIIDLLSKFGHDYIHHDCFAENKIVYYYGIGRPQLSFEESCVDDFIVSYYLSLFGISESLTELFNKDCYCDY